MFTLSVEQSDHFFNSPEVEAITQYSPEKVREAAQAFLDRTRMNVSVEELVDDFLERL